MEVARQIRVSNQAVYFWESEKRIPGVLHLNALRDCLNVISLIFYKRKKVTEYDEL